MAKKESKKARKRRQRAKIQFGVFSFLFLVMALLGLELSLIVYPNKYYGIIQAIDLQGHTLLLTAAGQTESMTVTWTDSTEFFLEKVKSNPAELVPGLKGAVSITEPIVFPGKVLKISAYTNKLVTTDGK